MDLIAWLKTWLGQHPLKEPSEDDRARLTAQVMTRIRALTPPAPAPVVRRFIPWPGRAALALATAAAGIAVVLAISPRTMRMAESPTEDEAWMSETISLLDEFEADAWDGVLDESVDEEWLEELEWLDEEEFATAS